MNTQNPRLAWLPRDPTPVIIPRAVQLALMIGLGFSGQIFAAGSLDGGRIDRSPANVPAGLATSDWAGIRGAYDRGLHAVLSLPDGAGYHARNPGQRWQTHFDGRGFLTQPEAAGWRWGLELESYGFRGREQSIGGEPRVQVTGHRVAYDWNSALQEWFVNDARGLEHGFTLRERPTAALAPEGESASLEFVLAVRGGLRPRILPDQRSVAFTDAQGQAVVNYTGLTVFDADGRRMPARFESVAAGDGGANADAPARLRLVIDERDARYPLTIDPIAQQAYLKASNADAGDRFGTNVAVSGNTVVIGASGESSSAVGVNDLVGQFNNGAVGAGAAYVFVRDGVNWTQQAYLKASNPGAGDAFGTTVAISGDTIVVGASGEASNATGVNGDEANNGAASAGAAYVFVRSGSTWSQQAYLKASNTAANDRFGVSVSVSGDIVVVGATGEDSNASGINGDQANNSAASSGAAYVFVRTGSTWAQEAYVKASNTGGSDAFGATVAISGDTMVVGATGEDSNATGVNPAGGQANNAFLSSGAVYVFLRTGATWSQQAYLKASNTGANDLFGGAVAIAGDTIVVGASAEDSNATGVNGTQANETANSAGAAYVFFRTGDTWAQQAYLKASNTGANDQFGISVAVAGDVAVVGAAFEDSDARGVDGTQTSESAPSAGAAYVFTRSAGAWTHHAYLKAGNSDSADFFGVSVAVSAELVLVGAPGEASSAREVNGNLCDNSFANAGAAYVFDFNGVNSAGPEISVEQPAGNILVDGATTANFGGVLLGGNVPREFTIRNLGGANLTGFTPSITGDQAGEFVVTAAPGSSTLGPCASTTFTVTFTPGGAGERLAVLHLANNDANEAPFDISLAGVGLAPQTLAQQAYLKASNTDTNDQFGYAVALSGDTLVVGASFESSSATGLNGNQADNSALFAGAVYVFVRSGAGWTQQAYLKPFNTDANDFFGRAVAISGDTIVVGAPGEASGGTGVGADKDDNSAAGAGAVYVFVGGGSNWTQQAYLKASNTGANDAFGTAVAISGDTLVVGATGEDSNATGAGGNQADDSAPNSGAAYVFTRVGSAWSQQAYLKASNSGSSDEFGSSVALSGETLVVGAMHEDSAAAGVNHPTGQADNSAVSAGAAYVFVRSGSVWTQQAYLKASNPGVSDFFGGSVAIAGDTVVVGAFGEDSHGTGVDTVQANEAASGSGAAYIFQRTGETWAQQAYVKASNTGANDSFGLAVAVDGDTALVGAQLEGSASRGVNGDQLNNNAGFAGAGYLFQRIGATWVQTAYLKAANTDGGDQFGSSVALAGGLAVLSATGERSWATGVNGDLCDNRLPGAGAVHVFDASGMSSITPEISLEQPAGNPLVDGVTAVNFAGTLIGSGVARPFAIRNVGGVELIAQAPVVIGANATDFVVSSAPAFAHLGPCAGTNFTVTFTPSAPGARTAVLQLVSNDPDESTFDVPLLGTGLALAPMTQQAYAKASHPGESDEFGGAVALSGDTMIVGDPGESSDATGVNGDPNNDLRPESGAAYIFVRSGNVWVQQAYLKASDADAEDRFGTAVAIAGDYAVVGAPEAGLGGSAYVFVRNGGNWSQQALLKASNAGGKFGHAVGLSGDTAVVGAYDESSNATGVNGNQSDTSASGAGAAYVFVRSGATWNQQAYLKASNTDTSDQFGRAVSISGDTILVGARGEGSAASGVNGNQADDSLFNVGAGYVFVRSGDAWSQQAYLKASNPELYDYFGTAVAISGDLAVIGAPGESSSAGGVDGNQTDNKLDSAGAAYVFVRTGDSWSQQAYLKALRPDELDRFGSSVAVSGELVVVGAPNEDSSATGVNGDQLNNSAYDAGAAYVFTRQGTVWGQLNYLKASNAEGGDPNFEGGDKFGSSVAISGDTILAGAPGEDSNATGINGNQGNNGIPDAGAAYSYSVAGGPVYVTTPDFDTINFITSDYDGGFYVRSAKFEIGNAGRADLVIQSIERAPVSSLIEVVWRKMPAEVRVDLPFTLPPGDSGVSLEVRLVILSGHNPFGTELRVVSNDPQNSLVVYPLLADETLNYESSVEELSAIILNAAAGRTSRVGRRLDLAARDEPQTVTLTLATNAANQVTAEVPDFLGGGSVVLTNFTGSVTITLLSFPNDGTRKFIRVDSGGFVAPSVRLPSGLETGVNQLTFGAPEHSQGILVVSNGQYTASARATIVNDLIPGGFPVFGEYTGTYDATNNQITLQSQSMDYFPRSDRVQLSPSVDGMYMIWINNAVVLEESTNLLGQWRVITNAASPYRMDPSQHQQQFFRLRQVTP